MKAEPRYEGWVGIYLANAGAWCWGKLGRVTQAEGVRCVYMTSVDMFKEQRKEQRGTRYHVETGRSQII